MYILVRACGFASFAMKREKKKEEVNKILKQESGVMKIYKRGHSGLFDSNIFSPVLKISEDREMIFSDIVDKLREQRSQSSKKAGYQLAKKDSRSKQVAYEIENIKDSGMGNIFSNLKKLSNPQDEFIE